MLFSNLFNERTNLSSLLAACLENDAIALDLEIQKKRKELSQENASFLSKIFSGSNSKIKAFLNQFNHTRNDEMNFNATQAAAFHGFDAILHQLAQAGADVKLINNKGYNTLHFAVDNNQTATATTLLGMGIDPQSSGEYGRTALHIAAYNGHTQSVRLLLTRTINIDAQTNDEDGRQTALHNAAFQGHAAIAQLLMMAGANCQLRNAAGHTPLHEAVFSGNAEIVTLMLDGFVNLLDESDFKKSCDLLAELLKIAYKRKHAAVIKVFETHELTSVLFKRVRGVRPLPVPVPSKKSVSSIPIVEQNPVNASKPIASSITQLENSTNTVVTETKSAIAVPPLPAINPVVTEKLHVASSTSASVSSPTSNQTAITLPPPPPRFVLADNSSEPQQSPTLTSLSNATTDETPNAATSTTVSEEKSSLLTQIRNAGKNVGLKHVETNTPKKAQEKNEQKSMAEIMSEAMEKRRKFIKVTEDYEDTNSDFDDDDNSASASKVALTN
jgi:ankyrin repeat protein